MRERWQGKMRKRLAAKSTKILNNSAESRGGNGLARNFITHLLYALFF